MENKIYKVGIIGTENLHAKQFAGIFSGNEEYSDIRVTHIGGMYPEANAKLKEQFPDLDTLIQRKETSVGAGITSPGPGIKGDERKYFDGSVPFLAMRVNGSPQEDTGAAVGRQRHAAV